jgi:hypothetical protein
MAGCRSGSTLSVDDKRCAGSMTSGARMKPTDGTFWPFRRSAPPWGDERARPGTAPPAGQGTGVALETGRSYGSGYDDASVERMAAEDGHAAIHDRSIWGDNTDPRVIHMMNAAADANRGLIAHAFRQAILGIFCQLEETGPQAAALEQQALADSDAEALAEQKQEHTRQQMEREGHVPPHWIGYLLVPIGLLLALVFGDLAPLAMGFQVFGLSDAAILGIPLLDELHLAASASVFALMLLAHFAADDLRGVLHDLDRRRLAEGTSGPPPAVSWWAVGKAICWIACAIALMVGMVMIRATYLAAQGEPSQSGSFLAIQVGIFAAALAASLAHAHPYGRTWRTLCHCTRDAARRAAASCALHLEVVARHNALLDTAETLLAQAGHHVDVSVADTVRQGQAYARRVQLSQPEPVVERLFPKQLPAPRSLVGDALRTSLVGLTHLPQFTRLDTGAVNERRAQHRAELERLRASAGMPPTAPAQPADASAEGSTPEQPLPTPPEPAAASTNGSGGAA